MDQCENIATKSDRKLRVPEFNTIFPLKHNPIRDNQELQESWLKEMFDFSLLSEKNFAKIRSAAEFALVFYPFCTDLMRMEIVFKITVLLFVVDDHCDVGNDVTLDIARDFTRSEMIWGQMKCIHDKLINKDKFYSMVNWRPYVVYNYMLWEVIYNESNDNQKERLKKRAQDVCAATIIENQMIKSSTFFKTVDDYLKVRRDMSCCYLVYLWLRYSAHICLTEKDHDNPLLQRYLYLATNIICLDNDVYSFEKEFIEGNSNLDYFCFNAVSVEARVEGCDIETAIQNIISRLIKEEAECNDIYYQIDSDTSSSDELKTYVYQIRYVMAGNHWLSINATRYNQLY